MPTAALREGFAYAEAQGLPDRCAEPGSGAHSRERRQLGRVATRPSNTHLNPSSIPRAASRIGPCAPLGRPCHSAAACRWVWGSLPSPDGCPAFPLCPPCPRCPGARAPLLGCSGTLPRSCAKCKVSRSFTTGHAGRSGWQGSFIPGLSAAEWPDGVHHHAHVFSGD
ncbi:MAG: hypothetical protein RLZZ274_2001 [Cyanobacteriota bacterium]